MGGSTVKSKPKSKQRQSSNGHATKGGKAENGRSHASDAQLAPFYAAGPVIGLSAPVQTKVAIGQPGDRYEREADAAAARVTAGLPTSSISSIAPGGLGGMAQRQEEAGAETEEAVQEMALQRQAEAETAAEEPVQETSLQRQEEDGETEEPVQEMVVQQQQDDEADGSLQTLILQRQAEGEEPIQEMSVQRQEVGAETEEAVQEMALQRQEEAEEPAEESVQEMSLQRQVESAEIEEPVQEAALQRQEKAEEPAEETVQEMSLHSQEAGAETEEPVQEMNLQRQEDAETTAEEPVQEIALQRQEEDTEAEEPLQDMALKRQEEAGESAEEPVQQLSVQRQAEGNETEEPVQELTLQRQSDEAETVQSQQAGTGPGTSTPAMHTAAASAIHSKGAGEVINPPTRNKLESSLGVDLSDVRVHQDGGAHSAARTLKARAFTHKNHIWLGPGASQDDLELMAHESTHVLQQDGIVRRKPEEPDSTQAAGQERADEREEEEGATSSAARSPSPASAAAPGRTTAAEEQPVAEAAATRVPGAGGEADVGVETEEGVAADAEAVEEEEPGPAAGEAEVTEKPEAKMGEAQRPTEKGEEAEDGPEAEGTEEAEGAEASEDSDAEAEQRLEKVMENLGSLTRQQQGVAASGSKARATSKSKAVAASKAAPSPENEAAAHGKGAQVETMAGQEKGEVKKQSFLELVRSKLRQMDMPKNPKEMSDFKKRGGASGLKGDLLAGAKEQQAAAQGAIATATAAEPRPADERKPVDLPPPEEAPHPRRIDAQEVLPPPKSESETSLQRGKDEVEGELAKENLNKDRLVKASDPRFTAAQESREEVHTHAEQGPQAYRETEQATLAGEKAAVTAEERTNARHMGAARKGSDAAVVGGQKTQMSKEEKARQKIASDLETIYGETKTQVENKLKWLDGEVDSQFTIAETRARNKFENFVEDELDKWKDKRYSGLRGKWTWVKDRFRDINELPAAKKIYTDGQDLYFKELDKGIVDIGALIDKTLAWCQEQIKKGRKKVQDYLANLDDSLKQIGAEAGEEVLGKFSDLKDEVNDHRDALADKLVQRYQESREKLNARLEEIKDANRSLVIKAKRKIEAVIDAIRKFRDRLMSILSKVRDVVELILDDPIGFLKNLLAAVKQGFSQFKQNIGKHLMEGVFAWLFGTFGQMGIQLPKDFSVKSIVGFILQVLGITWDRIRQKAVRLIGERNVAVIEKVVGYLSTLFREGPAGLWEEIKEDLGNLKDMVIEGIKDWLITRIVTAAVTKLVSMFNPVGAIVQAVLTIYNVVMFFVERIDQILQLVETIIGSLASIVSGKIDAAANFIERAMAQAIPIIISFLARLLGLGGIAERVKKIIGKVRRRVDKAIDKALRKIVARFKGFVGKGKAAVKKGVEKIKAIVFPKTRFNTGAEAHVIWIDTKGPKPVPVVSSKTAHLTDFIATLKSRDDISDAKKKDIPGAQSIVKDMEAVLSKIEKEKDSKKDATTHTRELLKHEKRLATLLRSILSGTKSPNRDMYKLEGMVATYGTMPTVKGDNLTPDHQPQKSIIKVVGKLPDFAGTKAEKMAQDRNVNDGAALNVYDKRHKMGRTWGPKGGKTKATFVAKLNSELVPLNSKEDRQGKAINLLKGELAADVDAMKAVYDQDPAAYPDIKDDPKLVTDVKKQGKAGADRIKSQDLDSLKGSG